MRGDKLNPTEQAVFSYLQRNPQTAFAVSEISLGLERETEQEFSSQNVRRACYELWRANLVDVARTDPAVQGGRVLCFYYLKGKLDGDDD
jgi:hypothetical protein